MTSALVNDEGAFAGGLFTLAVEQLAEPDSPTPPALCYTVVDTFGCEPGAEHGLVG